MAVKLVSNEHAELIIELFNNTMETVRIISPFVTTKMAEIFIACKKQKPDLDAKMITRFYREDFIQGVSSIKAIEKLCKSGIEIYALKDLHAKLYMFDSDTALIGSANFTSGGFKMNHELSLCISGETEVNPVLISHFDKLVNDITSQSSEYLLTIEKILGEQAVVETDIKKRKKDKKTKYTSEKRFGATLPTSGSNVDKQEQDIIQNILSKTDAKSYDNTIWIKFEGSSKFKKAMTEVYAPYVTSQIPMGATFFSKNKKPTRVKAGDYVYMAVHCESDLPYIVGRGRSEGYNNGNIATQEMVAENKSLTKYSYYYRFMEFEYITAPISECISIKDALIELGSDFYVSTVGKMLSIDELRLRHRQQAHMRLTSKAKDYIDNLFGETAKRHGVRKILSPN